jgi:four helix bundle protein
MAEGTNKPQCTGDIRSYRDLVAWQAGMALAKRVYGATRLLPKEEQNGLCQQMRKAAVSVPANIAEGWGRGRRPDYLRFLRIARGSLYETETQILLCRELAYLTDQQAGSLLKDSESSSKLLHRLIQSLERTDRQ